ncbi:MerR family transcriptional regulator [Mesosutterella sp. OilRF-GAM-744-9]|uniref:MerR family transcriptional regulator n=1 Tax=Mesosutterella porci TaxID=2915351 RepID=A0ABS9MSW0_9BURK|nr:MerR family transcriptional regulator [Mesosutterella sp. oilRF-744-WT-GAM-9]MCG5031707.1 MerR family transcriptional regulator [Mesosutterella sp. oilRF-744-WT-GAM-9]
MAERKTEDLPPIPDKRFFTIGEAAELVGVATSVLRFWEEEFKQLSPGRHGSRRRYERKDILKAREIRELLYDKGFTLAGAKKYLKRKKTDQKVRAAAGKGILEELEDIRASIRDFLL